MKSPGNDTIAAIATGVGGGIGIVRVSGPDALPVAERIFSGRAGRPLSQSAPFLLVRGSLADPVTAEPIDEVLAVRMPAGRSYTGESTVEIQAHGGRLVLDLVLQAALRAGARLAGPGEFTRRAFLNNRLDLTAAEAIADIVGAESEEALRGALGQLRGGLADTVARLRGSLLSLVACAEAALDFEEDGSVDPPSAEEISSLASQMRTLAARATASSGARGGVRVVIAGPTNAGKSSIFNYLLGFERSMVTADPGTTRDYVDGRFLVGDSSVTLIDTAGVRPTVDPVEAEGIRRSFQRIGEADIIVLVLDGTVPPCPGDRDLLKLTAGRSAIVVVSKSDQPARRDREEIQSQVPGLPVFILSTTTGEGFAQFTTGLAARCQAVQQKTGLQEPLPNLRHRNCLERAADLLEIAARNAGNRLVDQEASDLRSALAVLDEISGQTATEEILENIFSRFCIGK